MSETVVETKDLTKSYGSFVALDRLSISVRRGQILGFIGPNGAGKTTTIKILVGLARPTTGTATVAGVDCIADARKVKRLVGYMPDTFGSYDNMRVQEYLDFFGAAYKIPRRERMKRMEAVMEATGSTYMRDRFVDSLSHGMKQRVGIARTLLHDPPVLILDEPANGLDPTARVEMRQILLRLAHSGKTLIVTSHILPELSRICDTVAIITKGQLRAFGPLDQIMRGIRQRRLIEIQLLQAADLARAQAMMQKHLDPADEVMLAKEELTLRTRTMATDENLSEMLGHMVAQGVKVAQFREVQQDLEDAFLEVTRHDRGGSGDREAAAGARSHGERSTAVTNPIIQRELIGLLRSRRAFAAQVILAAVLALLIALRWPESGRVNISGEQAQAVLRLFGYGLLVSLILLAPIFPASAIVREKQQRTLELLLNSPLTPWSIFLGKLVASLGFILLLLFLSVPAAAACFAMGGVDTNQILHVYAILAVVAVEYSVVALFVSTVAANSETALRYTYGAIMFLTLIPLIPQKFVQGQVAPLLAQIVDTFACISPLPAMMDVLGDRNIGSQGLLGPAHVEMRYFLSAAVVIAIFLPLTLLKLNYRLFDRSRSSGKITDDRSVKVKLFRRIMYLWFFDPQRRTKLIGPFTNPVMVKDFRSQKFGRAHWMMRFFVICMVISLGLMLATTRGTITWGVETLGSIIVIMQMAVVVLVSPSLAAGAISSERESGGWTLLQMTPLSPFTIVLGKLMSAGRTLFFLLVATLPSYAVILKISASQSTRVSQVLITVVLTSIFALTASAAISSLFKWTTAATATSYALLVSLCGGTMLFWLGQGAPFSRSTVESALRFNPLAAALQLIQAPGFRDYNLVPFNWYMLGAGIALALMVLLVQTWRLSRPQ